MWKFIFSTYGNLKYKYKRSSCFYKCDELQTRHSLILITNENCIEKLCGIKKDSV